MYRIANWLFIPGKGWVDTAAGAGAGAGCIVPFFIFFFISAGLAYFIRPTREYKYREEENLTWQSEMNVEYQKWIGSDSIFGNIWYYDGKYVGMGRDESYQVDSRFRGVLIGNDAYIELRKPEVKYSEDYSYDYKLPDKIHLTLTDDEVIFRDGVMTREIKAPGKQATWNMLFDQFDWDR